MITSLPHASTNSPPHRPHRRRSGDCPGRHDEIPHVDGRPRSSSLKSGDDEPPLPLLRVVTPVVLSDPRVRYGRQSTVLQMSDANLSRLLDARGGGAPSASGTSGMVREAGGRSSMSGNPTSSGNPKLGAPGAERRGSKLFITADTKFRTLKRENNYAVVREGGSEGGSEGGEAKPEAAKQRSGWRPALGVERAGGMGGMGGMGGIMEGIKEGDGGQVPVDTTGDGVTDAIGHDTTGDGNVDMLDTNLDGTPDTDVTQRVRRETRIRVPWSQKPVRDGPVDVGISILIKSVSNVDLAQGAFHCSMGIKVRGKL